MYNRQYFEKGKDYKIIGNYCIHKYHDYDDNLFNFDDSNYENTIGIIYKFNCNNIVGIIYRNTSTGKVHVEKSYL